MGGMDTTPERRKGPRRSKDRELLSELYALHQQAIDTSDKRQERRRAIRHMCSVHMALRIAYSTGKADDTWNVEEHPVKGRLLDLSDEGCAVFTEQRLELGQEIKLIITLRSGSKVCGLGGVRWVKGVRQRQGFASGILFNSLNDRDKKLIGGFLHELEETLGL